MNSEEYEALKQFYIDVEDKLSLADYEEILEENDFHICYKNNKEWRIKTACHNIDTKDAHPNLRFNLDNRVFTCFSSCSCSYNIYTLLQKRYNLIGKSDKSIDVLKYICEFKGIKFNFSSSNIPSTSNKSNWKKILSKYNKEIQIYDKIVYNKADLEKFPKKYHTDWLDYGITEEVMEKYNIRYYDYKSQIVIPCNDKVGDLIGVRVRNINPDSNAKYKPLKTLDGTLYAFPTEYYLYGENFNLERIRRLKEVWLVEAEKSVMKSEVWFEDNNVALGLYGLNLTPQKLKTILSTGANKAVIMIDSDFHKIGDKEYEIFEKNVMKIAQILKPYMQVFVCYNNQGYDGYKYSPFDFTREQFDILYENKEEIS